MNNTMIRTHFKIKKTNALLYHSHPYENLPRRASRNFMLARSRFSQLANLRHLEITMGINETDTAQGGVDY